jgi:hypothetical protein
MREKKKMLGGEMYFPPSCALTKLCLCIQRMINNEPVVSCSTRGFDEGWEVLAFIHEMCNKMFFGFFGWFEGVVIGMGEPLASFENRNSLDLFKVLQRV